VDESLDRGLTDRSDSGVPTSHSPVRDTPRAGSLAAALRRARIENAERSDVLADLRGAELTRLEILREHLEPVLAEVPVDCDLFDPGIMPGERPRLFIDMIAFVEMARDRRVYSFVQDTRAGRTIVAESDRIDTMVKAVTDYIARRLIEREKALATLGAPPRPFAMASQAPVAEPGTARAAVPARERPRAARLFARSFLFLVEVVGSAVVFGALAAGGLWLWQRFAPLTY
jgi:hypothetical protein